MPNNYFNHQIALSLDTNGIILEVLFNSYTDFPINTGMSVIHLFNDSNLSSYFDHLAMINSEYLSTGYRAQLVSSEFVYIFMFKQDDIIRFFAIQMEQDILQLFDEMVTINNQQMNDIRSLYKRLTKTTENSEFLEEIMKLNNTLINTRRELHSKNRLLTEMNHTLESITDTDYLTQIPNRRKFFKDIYLFVETEDYELTMMDINNFKLINDQFGHKRGDEAIQYISTSLQQYAQQYDGFVYRLGGDEFALLIASKYHLDYTDMFSELDASITQFHPLASCSFGTTTVTKENCNQHQKAEVSMAKADGLMYAMKQAYYEKHPSLRDPLNR